MPTPKVFDCVLNTHLCPGKTHRNHHHFGRPGPNDRSAPRPLTQSASIKGSLNAPLADGVIACALQNQTGIQTHSDLTTSLASPPSAKRHTHIHCDRRQSPGDHFQRPTSPRPNPLDPKRLQTTHTPCPTLFRSVLILANCRAGCRKCCGICRHSTQHVPTSISS